MCLSGAHLATLQLGGTSFETIHGCPVQRSLLEATFTHEISTYLSSQRGMKVEQKTIYRKEGRGEFTRDRQSKL